MAEHSPAYGTGWMSFFFCFACVHSFSFTYLNVFISTQKFSYFYPSSSHPHPGGGECVRGGVVLSCQLRLNNDKWILDLKQLHFAQMFPDITTSTSLSEVFPYTMYSSLHVTANSVMLWLKKVLENASWQKVTCLPKQNTLNTFAPVKPSSSL